MDRGTQPRMTEHLLYARIASAMKRALLQLEEVEFSAAGRTLTDRFYY